MSRRRVLSLLTLPPCLFILAWGSLVTVHATTPHACTKRKDAQGHVIVHNCQHGPNTIVQPEVSSSIQRDRKQDRADALPGMPPFDCEGCNDGTGCICQWTCIVNGAFGLNGFPRQPPGNMARAVLQHGLFYHPSK